MNNITTEKVSCAIKAAQEKIQNAIDQLGDSDDDQGIKDDLTAAADDLTTADSELVSVEEQIKIAASAGVPEDGGDIPAPAPKVAKVPSPSQSNIVQESQPEKDAGVAESVEAAATPEESDT